MKIVDNYSFFGLIKLGIDIVKTKLFYSKSRLIRGPFYIRGKKFVNFGTNLTTGVGCRIDAFPIDNKKVIKFGKDVQINDYVHIGAIDEVSIGNNVLIASKVFITDHNHGNYSENNHCHPNSIVSQRELSNKKVIIEDNVWIGEFVSILPGVTIGENSIIGSMSVVTKNIPSNVIAFGSPAKVIKEYNFETKKWEKV
jgi:acetyltransferase-like isoleucine patch superfamily enzyme